MSEHDDFIVKEKEPPGSGSSLCHVSKYQNVAYSDHCLHGLEGSLLCDNQTHMIWLKQCRLMVKALVSPLTHLLFANTMCLRGERVCVLCAYANQLFVCVIKTPRHSSILND